MIVTGILTGGEALVVKKEKAEEVEKFYYDEPEYTKSFATVVH